MTRDWESEFADITGQLDLEMPNPEVGMSILELNQTIFNITEASLFLSQFVILAAEDKGVDFPENLINIIHQLNTSAEVVSQTLSGIDEDDECVCDECSEDDELE